MWISSQTAAWAGTAEVIASLPTLTEAGRHELRATARTPMSPEAWREDRSALLSLESAESARPGLLAAVAAQLRGLGALGEVIGRVRGGVVPELADLFRVKQVVRAVLEVGSLLAASGVSDGVPGQYRDGWESVFGWLHLQGDPDSRFVLSDGHDERLRGARSSLAAALRREFEAAGAARREAESRIGTRLSRELECSASDRDPHAAALRDDPGFELVARIGGELRYRLRREGAWAEASGQVEQARARLLELETEVLRRLGERLAGAAGALEAADAWVVALDLRLARIELRRRWDGCWPEPGGLLSLDRGRLPWLDQPERPFVAQTFALRRGVSTLVGANMGGKSVALRLAALVQWCGQRGMPAPARAVTFVEADWIEVVAGELGDPRHGLSSFGGEVDTWRRLLERGGTGVVLADEPCRTTNPAEGAALADALVTCLARRPHWAMVATHFAGVGADAIARYRIAGLAAGLLPRDLDALHRAMDYRIILSDAEPPHDALRIAEALGLADEVLDIARRRLAAPPGASRETEP
jgi:hypothetical protein